MRTSRERESPVVGGRLTNVVFGLLLLGQLVLLTSQVRDPTTEKTQLERSALTAVAPVAHSVSSVVDASKWLQQRFETRESLQEENARLRSRLEMLERERVATSGLDVEVERLSDALGYKPPFDGQVRLADVVYIDHASWLRTLLLYIPGQWATENSPVTSADGLVGRVVLMEGSYAKVQLITDRASGIGAMIERTRRQGVVRGAGSDGLTLEYVPLSADVRIGDKVISAGTDGLYPRGLPIGVVVDVGEGGDLFQQLTIMPSVDFGALDQVFVLRGGGIPERLRGTLSASP